MYVYMYVSYFVMHVLNVCYVCVIYYDANVCYKRMYIMYVGEVGVLCYDMYTR